MNRKKIVVLVVVLITVLIGLRSLDLKVRYNMSWSDYYRYSGGLSVKEKTLLKEESLLIGVYNDPPLSFINKFNNYNAGIMVDYISQLAIELSSDIYLKAASKDKVLAGLENNEIDIAVIERTDSLEKVYLFSQSLCTIRGRIAVRNNSGIEGVKDLEAMTLVTLKKDNIDGQIDDFFKHQINIHIIEVENMYQCFALIRNNIAVGYVGDDMEVAHFLNVTNKGSNYNFLEPILYEKEVCIAVNNGRQDLVEILNKGILNLKRKNLITQTQRKWLGDFDSHGIDLWQLDWAYKVVSAIMVIVAVFSSWNYIITQRVNTKTRELSESKAELRLIIDTLQSGIMVIENDETIVECNDGMTHLTGIKRESLIGSNYTRINTLEPFVKEDNMDQLLNLSDKYYYITSQPFGNSKKLIMIEDYTEKYVTEQRARQESKMIAVGQLSAGLAHEIRNPLGLIKSYIYIIEKYCTTDICKHAIFVINDSVGRINGLIENLLRFSRLSNDEHKTVDIENLVELILTLEKKNFEKNQIEVKSRMLGQTMQPVVLNEDVLKMILLNLINNSIESFVGMDKSQKEIVLEMAIESNELRIKLADNGCGIERDKLENIFNPFYSTKETGTGLGLYLINTEIINNDGSITVESTFGEGTEFNIVLPIKG